MKYHIGDRFLINDIEAQVAYVNQGYAWVVPTEGNIHIVFARLDKKGYTQEGKKAIAYRKDDCMAV